MIDEGDRINFCYPDELLEIEIIKIVEHTPVIEFTYKIFETKELRKVCLNKPCIVTCASKDASPMTDNMVFSDKYVCSDHSIFYFDKTCNQV